MVPDMVTQQIDHRRLQVKQTLPNYKNPAFHDGVFVGIGFCILIWFAVTVYGHLP